VTELSSLAFCIVDFLYQRVTMLPLLFYLDQARDLCKPQSNIRLISLLSLALIHIPSRSFFKLFVDTDLVITAQL